MSDNEAVLAALPFARRYARALMGTQEAGDALVAKAIPLRDRDMPPRLGLYAAINAALRGRAIESDGIEVLDRQLLLLTALEELPISAAAEVVGLGQEAAAERVEAARVAVRRAAATDVLVIEDEPIIAMDVRMLVERCGHRVVGIAASEEEADAIARSSPIGLILADVNLGRGGNGIDAVRRILRHAKVPVIFVTAYPESLLTATGLEPAFVMRKPFDRETLAIATYQATTSGRIPLV